MFPLGAPVLANRGGRGRRGRRRHTPKAESQILRVPKEDGAFDVHHPYLQMRNLHTQKTSDGLEVT